MKITKRTANITPSLTLAITAKANKLKEKGRSIIAFSAGEPDFNTPEPIINAAIEAMRQGKTKYTASSGLVPLRKAICKKFMDDNGLEYEPGNIIVSNGAKHSLYNAVMALVDAGDEVIIPAPYWLTYPELVTLAGGKSVIVNAGGGTGILTADELRGALTDKTKMLILNSPSNPTGFVYTKEQLEDIAKVLKDYPNVTVLSDEIYEKLVYGVKHISIASIDGMFDRTIVVNGVSKTYSMTGFRIGYLAAPLNVAKAIDGMQSHATSNACTISQYAAIKALACGAEFEKDMLSRFDVRRKALFEGINKLKGLKCSEPKGAFYVWVNVRKLFGKCYDGTVLETAHDVADTMLDEGLAVVPGEAFGAPNFIRLSYAVSDEDIKLGLERIGSYLNKLNN